MTGRESVTLAASGDISLAAAAATSTTRGSSKSSGASIGVSISAQGIAATASVNSGRGNYAGSSTSYTDTVASAGGTARVTTPGALGLIGGQLSGSAVKVDAGSLDIASLQDSSTYSSKSSSVGFGVSVPVTGVGKVGVSGSFSSSHQNGTFESVGDGKQAGIHAGAGGFDIKVAGNTDLTGGVIASAAGAGNNRLITGTLTASDIENSEAYSASQMAFGGGITFGSTSNIGQGNDGKATTPPSSSGSALPGVKVAGLGTVSATPPVAMGASGSQSSTTRSAIAPGTIVIASGDAASQAVADAISRDTAGANAALTQEFTQAKREEIAQGFQAAQALTQQVGTFLSAQAAKADEWTEQNPQADPKDNPYATWGAGGTGQLVLTALNGAAGANVTGSLGSLVQGAAVNVLQGLATSQVKEIADSLGGSTTEREAVRSALQGIVGCAGSAAGGSGDCGAAAMGAATSVVINNLLKAATDGTTTATDKDGKPLSQEEQTARSNLVATLVGAIASASGLDVNAAITAAQIETQNNATLTLPDGRSITPCAQMGPGCESFESWLQTPDGQAALAMFGGDRDALNAYFAAPEETRGSMADAAARAHGANLGEGLSPDLQAELQSAFARLPDNEKEAYRKIAQDYSQLSSQSEMSEDELRYALVLFGGLPSATALSMPGAELAAQYSGQIAAVAQRTGRSPAAALALVAGAGTATYLLTPDAETALGTANGTPTGGTGPGNGPEDPDPKIPVVIDPEKWVGTTDDGQTIYKDERTGEEYTKSADGSRLPVGAAAATETVKHLNNEEALSKALEFAGSVLAPDDIPAGASLDNEAVRAWYLQQDARIPALIDRSLPLEQQAQQAWALRNEFRTVAREAMENQSGPGGAEELNATRPNLTWQETYKKYSVDPTTGQPRAPNEIYNEIISASQRTNQSVNESLGFKIPGN